MTPSRSLYALFCSASAAPASLQEEFELFPVMYSAARTYDLKTNLQKDPHLQDKREAVGRTLALITRTLEEEPHPIRLTLHNYASYIGRAGEGG